MSHTPYHQTREKVASYHMKLYAPGVYVVDVSHLDSYDVYNLEYVRDEWADDWRDAHDGDNYPGDVLMEPSYPGVVVSGEGFSPHDFPYPGSESMSLQWSQPTVDHPVSTRNVVELDEKNCTVNVYEEKRTYNTIPGVYVFMSGVGTDGGFGDYAPPYFSGILLDPESGAIIGVGDGEVARAVEDAVNDRLSMFFYSRGEHDTYDGSFPMEVCRLLIPVPANNVPVDVYDDVESLTDTLFRVANSGNE